MPGLQFAHPEPPRDRRRIRPVFLPFAGCPHRCLFCDQKAQTGTAPASLAAILATLEQGLIRARDQGEEPCELGLYGGTFTALPGDRPGVFRSDVDMTARLAPDCARLYPCLVLEGTDLAALWRAGGYAPWSAARARTELSLALTRLWRARVPVIRLGLAPEPGLSGRVLAGPKHPVLGQQARSLALLDFLRRQVARLGRRPQGLEVPVGSQGEFWGHGGSLERAYARLGLPRERVAASADGLFRLS